MKKLLFVFGFMMAASFVSAQSFNTIQYQGGYYKPSTGTYVQPHYKTTPNRTNHDNFSTQGNYNMYNGNQGTRARDYSPEAYNYGQGRVIYTGPQGGQYYINSNGNKTYVPKRGY
jgi:hypothetical protein